MFTQEQIRDMSAKLDPKHVKGRRQGGSTVQYIEGWHAIDEANRIFGFDAWDRETIDLRLVSERETTIGKGGQYEKAGFAVAYLAKVRVTVRASGTVIVREGCGYGSGIDADIGSAHESAVKEAETDAMKRGLMTFGNPFGLALYDKSLANVGHDEPPPRHNAPPSDLPDLPDPSTTREVLDNLPLTAPEVEGLAKFFAGPEYFLKPPCPKGSTEPHWPTWHQKMAKALRYAVDHAKSLDAVDKLVADNSLNTSGLAKADKALHADLLKRIDAARAALMPQAAE